MREAAQRTGPVTPAYIVLALLDGRWWRRKSFVYWNSVQPFPVARSIIVTVRYRFSLLWDVLQHRRWLGRLR